MKVPKSVAAAAASAEPAAPDAAAPVVSGTGRIVKKPKLAAPAAPAPKPKAAPKATPRAKPKAKPKAKATAKAAVKASAATKVTWALKKPAAADADGDVTPTRLRGKQTALVFSSPSAKAAAAVAVGSDDEVMGVSSDEQNSDADTEEVGHDSDAAGPQPSASQRSTAPRNKKAKKAKDGPPAAASTDGAEDRLRDKMKSHQFKKLFNELPDNIKDAYNAAKAAPYGSRQLCTKVVNSAIVRNDDGEYEVNNKSPVFTDIRAKYGDKYTDAKKKGIDVV